VLGLLACALSLAYSRKNMQPTWRESSFKRSLIQLSHASLGLSIPWRSSMEGRMSSAETRNGHETGRPASGSCT
jgi:hypothetical protein